MSVTGVREQVLNCKLETNERDCRQVYRELVLRAGGIG